ncbi:fluoride efflux transporter CrcB [Pelomonas sp. CA6]|uniref:fluoride efflux transporter CrcB n=1 Tax=Pelomonas sp. CA6 TaxID=2907999 RepID=UPI001F4C436B|nr:fluoride efflux transporter CrcB [Pelomonas sp. CA6]MCH7344057.1 fluoride efflux transporter CrcB [Pelomonas sp. CA6]
MSGATALQAGAVALGATLGAWARWSLALWLNPRWMGFPLGTLAVNVLGGLLIGMALEWLGRHPDEMLRLLLVTGFLGGLTTFSAFTGESLALLQRGQPGMALAHALAHLLGSLGAAALGLALMRALLR